jgi:hypothetical protein
MSASRRHRVELQRAGLVLKHTCSCRIEAHASASANGHTCRLPTLQAPLTPAWPNAPKSKDFVCQPLDVNASAARMVLAQWSAPHTC